MVPEVEDRSKPDKSAAIQFKYGKIRVDSLSTKHSNLKMLDAIIPWQRNYKYLGVTLDKNLHFRNHIERVRNTALFYKARLGAVLGRKSKLSRRNKRTIYKMCIRTVMAYASPVFAHAAPKAVHRLQVIQNKFCRAVTDAHWTHQFYDITGSYPNALLRAAVDYQPPHPTHLIRRPRNVLTDPPDALTAAVESLNDVNDMHDCLGVGLSEGREQTRDGFLRHPMPRRLPPGVVHSACHAPSALACAVRPHSCSFEPRSVVSGSARVRVCGVPRSVSRAAAVKPRASVPARSSGYPAVCTRARTRFLRLGSGTNSRLDRCTLLQECITLFTNVNHILDVFEVYAQRSESFSLNL
ncbi:Probable RNA-directed DNA polymerase from transposon BS [Eumeta japonica]|uniref:Probable RNA-directed DNA polymerase from transposon BS n=1 Tax=Eumeta variegata TaxID=151549 RepID=A0A4C1WI91_EUMVA|nr:Probable RNA-directed DNA polymerase from transposon BS [Eumeta japonica]